MFRDYDREFQNNYSNSFAESKTQNEKEFYSGVEFKTNLNWKFRSYIDLYQYPWLRHSSNTPTIGTDFFIQSDYKINRNTKIYFRYKKWKKGGEYKYRIRQIPYYWNTKEGRMEI